MSHTDGQFAAVGEDDLRMFEPLSRTLEMFWPLPLLSMDAQPYVMFRNTETGLTSIYQPEPRKMKYPA